MVDPATAKTVLYALLPFAIPWLVGQYRSFRAAARGGPAVAPRPVPPGARRALNLLCAAAFVAALSTLPAFLPENVFALAHTRLQTPSGVLWQRVAALRPNATLTPLDEALRARLGTLDGRCQYLAYGPDAIASCLFCAPDAPRALVYYALPAVLAPHLFHLAVLGLATSAGVAGPEGSRWRAPAVLLGTALALVDVLALYRYDWRAPAAPAAMASTRAPTPFYWRARVARGLGVALADALFAAFLWATATRRLWAAAPAAAERVAGAVRGLEAAAGKLAAAGIVENAALRDEGLRAQSGRYWRHEGARMGAAMADKRVVERVEREAKGYAESLLQARDQGRAAD